MASATDCTAPPSIHKGRISNLLVWVAPLIAMMVWVHFSVPGSLAAQTPKSELRTQKSEQKYPVTSSEYWFSLKNTSERLRAPDAPDEAERFYLKKRVPSGTVFPVEKLMAGKRQIVSLPLFSSRLGRVLSPRGDHFTLKAQAGISGWEPLGPGNIGGRTRVLVIDPAEAQTLYAGATSGGIWKTTNGGQSWQPLGDFLASLAVNALALDAKSSPAGRVLYAGTGEGYLNFAARRGAGIFKSTDSGQSWHQLPATTTPEFAYVNDIVLSPTDSRVLYVSTRTGVWKSLDTGETWQSILKTDGSGGPTSTIVETRQDTGALDLVIEADETTRQDILLVSSGSFRPDGIYRSIDSGATWSRVLTASNLGRVSMAIAPSNSSVIYALASRVSGLLQNVYRSTDHGATWEARIEGTFDPDRLEWLLLTNTLFASYRGCAGLPGEFLNQGWHDNTIAVSPTDSNTIFVGGIDLFRSDDGGRSFGLISYWWLPRTSPNFVHADQHAFVFDPGWNGGSNQTLYVGNDGGVFRTTNALAAVASGANRGLCYYDPSIPPAIAWTSLNSNYAVTQFYHGAVYPDARGLIGGAQDNGVLVGALYEPENWREIIRGDGGFCAVDPTTSGDTTVLYASNIGLSLDKSTDNGASFTRVTRGIRDDFDFIATYALDPSTPRILWTGGRRPWRTTDGAESWSDARGSDFATTLVSAIAVAPSNSASVYMGLGGGQVFHTINGLDQNPRWTVSAGLPQGWCNGLAVDPQDPNRAYATFSTFGVGHVWKTVDGGQTWKNIDGSPGRAIPDIPVNCIAVHPTLSGMLYVGTDLGVLVSTDDGQTWSLENTGFANAPVEVLVWETTSPSGEVALPPVLYAFTYGRGVFRAEINLAPPVAPTALRVEFTSGSLELSWTDASSDETAFVVERRIGSDLFRPLASLPPDTSRFQDQNLQDGTAYAYRVRANSPGGRSAYSNIVQLTTPGIASPTEFRVLPISATEVMLEWRDNSDNESGFVVERRLGTASYQPLATLSAGTTHFREVLPVADGNVTYRVNAIGPAGASRYSTESRPIPMAPVGLKAGAVSFAQVDLTWADTSTNEAGFVVERQRGTESAWTVITRLPENSTRFSHRQVLPGTTVRYRVRAVNLAFASESSNVVLVDVPAVPVVPLPPTTLTVISASRSEVRLEWQDASSNEDGFELERRRARDTNFIRIGTSLADQPVFTDQDVVAGTDYVYRVRAVNGGGTSPFSNEATATTPGVSPPESLSAQAASATRVNLSWVDTSSNETGFELERRAETETSFQKVATIGANRTQWVDEEVMPKTLYQYRVQAFTTEESSEFSAEATVQTPVAPPQITAIAPKKAKPGKLVTISGNNFENAVVFFGQLRVSLATASTTQLQFFVPQTPRGEVILTLTTPGGTAQINFRVK
ncbi:MAG: fibronectin type III domain-containing protein [Acidobacteria bacterium]|nr:fibronectin type III domain-containing protein [Acidobacteriota bacterium]